MPFQDGVDFSDGNISVDKLRILAENQEFVMNDPNVGVAGKPYGVLGLIERTTSYTDTATFNNIFGADNTLSITAPTTNRLIAIHLYLPSMWSGSNSQCWVYKDGLPFSFFSEYTKGGTVKTSIHLTCLDVLTDTTAHVFGVYGRAGVVGMTTIDIASNRPMQLWVEDLGATTGPFA